MYFSTCIDTVRLTSIYYRVPGNRELLEAQYGKMTKTAVAATAKVTGTHNNQKVTGTHNNQIIEAAGETAAAATAMAAAAATTIN